MSKFRQRNKAARTVTSMYVVCMHAHIFAYLGLTLHSDCWPGSVVFVSCVEGSEVATQKERQTQREQRHAGTHEDACSRMLSYPVAVPLPFVTCLWKCVDNTSLTQESQMLKEEQRKVLLSASHHRDE